jgi:hypothetical protein
VKDDDYVVVEVRKEEGKRRLGGEVGGFKYVGTVGK